MPSSMIGDREIVYSPANRRWHWGDTGEMLDEETEAKHFATDPPGQVWAEEDAKPARGRRSAADEADTE